MRKTLIALMFAAALPTVAMAMPEGHGPMGGPESHTMGGPSDHGGEHDMGGQGHGGEHGMGGSSHGGEHGMHGKGGPFSQLDLTREQRQQIGKLMGEQHEGRQQLAKKYLDKLPAAEQKAMNDEMAAAKQKTQADIRALLKPDQQKKFDEMAKKRAERKAEWQQFQAWKAQQPQKAQ